MASHVHSVVVRAKDKKKYLCKQRGDVSMTCGACQRFHVMPKPGVRCKCGAIVVQVTRVDGKVRVL